MPATRFSCFSISSSNARIRALDLVWRALGVWRIQASSSAIAFCLPGFLALFLLQPLGLLLQIAGIVALVGVVTAAIEFEHPVDDIIEEVAVVRHEDDVAGIFLQIVFQPRHAFGVEMVGRLVEQQDVRLFEQQLAERDAALLTARQVGDGGSRPAGSATPPSPVRAGCRASSRRPRRSWPEGRPSPPSARRNRCRPADRPSRPRSR